MSSEKNLPYRVLARKYRPQNFEQLIGQDALVRTLKNAIESGRIAHAFMLTGVRGVGKTTTARIIAKALNYAGPDGTAGPTTGPTDDCSICQAISEDRHPDVIEMDAATRTGVDDIREILDGVRYAPSQARYKIYIIDEVHMLSKNAFNALLKTLEEPPAHVKFIFATTEIRKVPITVLSRCQRFDLRRVDIPTLSSHYMKICGLENVQAEEAAIAMVARAADGSVRDGLSILDQAMALGNGHVNTAQIEEMLGLGDRGRTMDLLEHALSGEMLEALSLMDDLYRKGMDPVVLLQDLLDLAHILTRLRAVPETRDIKHAMAESEMARAAALAAKLSMPTLGKTWQILLKGLGEVQSAPNPQSAAEMILIRLAYAADLPDPADLLKKLQEGGSIAAPSSQGGGQPSARAMAESAMNAAPVQSFEAPRVSKGGAEMAALAHQPEPQIITAIKSLADVVYILEQNNEMLLASNIRLYVHPVKVDDGAQAGTMEIRIKPEAPSKLAQDIGPVLSRIIGKRWLVSLSQAAGAPTLAEQADALHNAEMNEIMQMPVIRDILTVFPDAKIQSITNTKNDKD
jgi:DNA polymerase-3 subunit gamma/tau